MRLIDADALKRAFCRNCYETCAGHCDDLQIIDDRPTIEAEPVRRGRWEHQRVDYEKYHVYGTCSECRESSRINNYCPWCGAKMEEQE